MRKDASDGRVGLLVSESPARAGSWARRRAVMVMAVLLAVAVLAAAGVVGWRWRHPTAFDSYTSHAEVSMRGQVAETVYVQAVIPKIGDHGQVIIKDASVRGLPNGSDVTIDYVLCTVNWNDGPLAAGREVDMPQGCTSVVPAVGADMAVGEQELMVAVTSSQPGVFRMQGVDVTYTDGWQTGTQHVGVRMRVSLSAA